MADEADLAFEFSERHLAHALASQRKTSGRLAPTGCCHNCGNTEGISQRLFCDADCSQDWEHQDTLRRKLGLPALMASTPPELVPSHANVRAHQ